MNRCDLVLFGADILVDTHHLWTPSFHLCSIQCVNSGYSGRFDGIDVLRGISIIAVVLLHVNLHMSFANASFESALPGQLARILFSNGANGVTVFFAISGFLITTMSIRRWGALSHVRIADFYRLRFARIVPLLIALLVILSVLDLSHVPGFIIKAHTSLPRALLAATTFHINWLESQRGYLPPNWDVLWSLSVEEVFYLFFPLICVLTRARASLVALLLAFVAVGPFARTVLTRNELWADYGYLSCMDAIALGCMAAMIAARVRFRPATLRALQIIGAALVLLIMTARPLVRAMHIYQFGLDVTCLALGTCLLQIAIAQRNRAGGLATASIRWVGRNSYEVYLTHGFVVVWGIQIFTAAEARAIWTPFLYVGLLGLAGLLGAVVARFYSEPLNRRLRASFGKKTTATPLQATAAAIR
jgi:peptidoglycan/LPS O-acetylase OafA/YrhL